MNGFRQDRRHDLMRRHLYRLAMKVLCEMRRQMPSTQEVDLLDAVQEAVVAWLTKPIPGLTENQVRAWLSSAARYHLARARARSTRYVELRERHEGPDSESDVPDRVLIREVLERALRVYCTDRTRRSVMLWAKGATSQEIAEDVGISSTYARQKVHVWMLSVRDCLFGGSAASLTQTEAVPQEDRELETPSEPNGPIGEF